MGGPQEALRVACLDVSGVRSECDSHLQAGLTAPLRERHREKAMRTFPPSPEVASAAAERDGRAAAQAALAGGASAAEADQASRAAVARTIARRAPLLYLVPIVFHHGLLLRWRRELRGASYAVSPGGLLPEGREREGGRRGGGGRVVEVAAEAVGGG